MNHLNSDNLFQLHTNTLPLSETASTSNQITEQNVLDVEYIYGFVWWGVCKQSRWRHSVTVPHTRWRICVTMATLWQQQDGGYMLLWKRYGNNKMAVMRYFGSVFYIFNSTVIDWTLIFYFFKEIGFIADGWLQHVHNLGSVRTVPVTSYIEILQNVVLYLFNGEECGVAMKN